MATVAELSGAKRADRDAPDSISFAPLLRNPSADGARSAMIHETSRAWVIREGYWKLCLCPGSGATGTHGNEPPSDEAWRAAFKTFGKQASREDLLQAPFVQLLDLASDPHEDHNLAAEHPEVVRELVALLEHQMEQGRSTPGPKLENDREVHLYQKLPSYARKQLQ